MAAKDYRVDGRQFRVKSDYEAALRDKAIIDDIKRRVSLENADAVLKLYAEMEAGAYRFETALGNDFDDEIFELVQKIKRGEFQNSESEKQKNRKKPKKTKPSRKDNKTNHKIQKKSNKGVSLESYDEEMRRQILLELQKREKQRKIMVVVCSLVAVLCFAYFGTYYYFIGRTDSTYSKWAMLREQDAQEAEAFAPVRVNRVENGETPEVLQKYKTLYNKNKSLIGWIKIADTNINYPVMQTINNEYYLDHNIDQEYDKNGSIFMDKDCDVIKPSTNLIIYGHHMKSGSMFGSLDKYSKQSYYDEHPTIEFDTIYEEGIWQIMYVFRSRIYKADEIVFKYYQFIDAYSEEEFNSYMNEMSNMSLYDTNVTANYGDQLLTLSTCDYSEDDGRFVVVAKRIK